MAPSSPTILGIDYSYTCPALCVIANHQPSWFVHYKKEGKAYPTLPHVSWERSSVETEVERYIELSTWVVDVVRRTIPDLIVIEDYAFAAHGRLTQLSENMGTLKVRLYEWFPDIPVKIVAPTTMKKFATGRGIATKDDIWAAFATRYPEGKEWDSQCHPKAIRVSSPAADIADAYFLAHYGYTHYETLIT